MWHIHQIVADGKIVGDYRQIETVAGGYRFRHFKQRCSGIQIQRLSGLNEHCGELAHLTLHVMIQLGFFPPRQFGFQQVIELYAAVNGNNFAFFFQQLNVATHGHMRHAHQICQFIK